ncbi:hypothetical protein BDV28DRAFT_147183 [Aspergillus coremiiformis]|uniref:Cupin type-2 domain-containing protein n=1 Tax=Aspergillus coremiiformis TaxID=138285 RepID=A0A5N6Z9K2_9EURO|nr:hypothetical protein BDV28DRAFT_147183 [Aspergillus coremiiformis]
MASTLHPDLPQKLGLNRINRYITMHDSNGKAIFAPQQDVMYSDRGACGVAWNYAVQGFPVRMQHDVDLTNFFSPDDATETSHRNTGTRIVMPNGFTFGMAEWGPGVSTPMHKTESIDFVAVISGEIELELDSGEKRVMKAGDVCVQRQSMHRWTNHSTDTTCRMVSVIVAAEKLAEADKLS